MTQRFSNYSILAFLLLQKIVLSSATCQDHEGPFTITEGSALVGESVYCSWVGYLCHQEEIQTNCPQTCNLCSGEQLDSSVSECVDAEGKFMLSVLGVKKGCAYIRRTNTAQRCATHVEARANCRATCLSLIHI